MLLFLAVFPLVLHAQRPDVADLLNPQRVDPRAPKVYYFPIDRHLLMRDYRTNKVMLDALDELMRDPKVINNIDTIEIFGGCSPVASDEYNRALALRRAEALKGYLHWKFLDVVKKIPFKLRAIGIDYEGYRTLKAGRHDLTEKQIWDLLQYTSVRLKMKDGTCIPPASESTIKEIAETTPETITQIIHDTVKVMVYDTVKIILHPKPADEFSLALKSNILYDLALLPNLGIEIPFGRWSALAYGHWSWWDTKSPNYWSHRIQWAGVGLRLWWGKIAGIPLTGHFIGLYGGLGTYDVRLFTSNLDELGYLSNLSYSTGLTYGYSLPLGGHWNMEFNLSAGYFAGLYYEYNRSRCADCYPEQANENRRYFGPTGAAINLVYRFGGPAYNKNKNSHEHEKK